MSYKRGSYWGPYDPNDPLAKLLSRPYARFIEKPKEKEDVRMLIDADKKAIIPEISRIVEKLTPLSDEAIKELEKIGEFEEVPDSFGYVYRVKNEHGKVSIVKRYGTYGHEDDLFECLKLYDNDAEPEGFLNENGVIEFVKSQLG